MAVQRTAAKVSIFFMKTSIHGFFAHEKPRSVRRPRRSAPVFEVGLFWDLQQACHVQGQEYDAVFLFYVLVV